MVWFLLVYVCVCAKGINRVVNWQVACYVDYTSAARASIAKYPKNKVASQKVVALENEKSCAQEKHWTKGLRVGECKKVKPGEV